MNTVLKLIKGPIAGRSVRGLTSTETPTPTPTPTPTSKRVKNGPGVVPEGFIAYFVLFRNEDGGIGYDNISVNKRPKGTPMEIAYSLASILGIDHDTVLGVLRADENVRVRVAHDGMEFRFSCAY